MPRAKAVQQSDHPYHITARCINREWFNLPMESVWNVFCEELTNINKTHSIQIHSFVLMSNHFHLIITTPEANVSKAMHQFMNTSSRKLTRAGNRINQTFAGRHYKCILDDYSYFMNAYKYNYRNPVHAKICESVEDYPYSSLAMKLGYAQMKLPLVEDLLLKEDTIGILKWLNTAPDPEKLEAVRFGLRRQYFKTKNSKFTNKPILEVNQTL